MFSDDVLEELLSRQDVLDVPLLYRSAMIHAIAEVLSEKNLLKEGALDEL